MNAPVSRIRPVSQPKRPVVQAVVTPSILYVFDTSVLLHDPTCLFRFEEHDIHVPLAVLEELDECKKGLSDLARNAREVARILDNIVAGHEKDLSKGVLLEKASGGIATGRLFLHLVGQTNRKLNRALTKDSADNKILKLAGSLQETFRNRRIVIVTKDTLLRLKAVAIGVEAQDYRNDHLVTDSDVLRSGIRELPDDFWETHRLSRTWHEHGHQLYEASGPLLQDLAVNETLILKGNKGEPVSTMVRSIGGELVTFGGITDYNKGRNEVWGCHSRNREQCIAFNLLMDPEIDYVTLIGPAGTGKTLLALAAGFEQVLQSDRYSGIIVVRETIPVGEDQGFLPGNETEKLSPWMGAVWDNLEVLEDNAKEKKIWNKADLPKLHEQIETKSLAFVRGRSFFKRFIIIDETQNLTPHQAKTLVTRAGPGTKLVFLGNLGQIDTPYLTEGSSGLAYLVNRMKKYPRGGHVILVHCERSELADYANSVL